MAEFALKDRTEKSSREIRPRGDPSEAHILVVDDDPAILQLSEWYLNRSEDLSPEGVGVKVHPFSSGAEALALARALQQAGEPIACALLDFILPEQRDGIEIINELWDLDPQIHCTLITGAGKSVEQEIEGRLPPELLDRWDYLAKPFTEFEIVLRVRRALSSWLAQQREERSGRENLHLLLSLARSNCKLEGTVVERTKALDRRNADQERKNVELEQAIHKLEAAQSQLLQQEKLASIGQLAAGVAHELNNPIGFVHSNLGTLGRYFDKIRELLAAADERIASEPEIVELKKRLKMDLVLDDLPDLLAESLEGTERVRKIVTDLKVFSRPAENNLEFASLNEGLKTTLNIVHNELKYKAEVVCEFGDIPPVRCFAGQINQVFLNILVNAAQAIEEHGEIRIRTSAQDGHVLVEIQDNGCGIPPEILSKIFDPFFTTKEVGKGTGLGLSISCDIVRKHGGDLSVQSEPGKGSCFRIRLPVDGGERADAG